MARKIEISYKTIVFSIFFVIFLWVLYQVKQVIMEFFVALLLMAVFNPYVSRLSKYKMPRSVSVLLVYLFFFSFVILSIAALVPPLAEQSGQFLNNFPGFLENLGVSSVVSDELIRQAVAQLGSLPSSVARVTVSVFGNVLSVLSVLVFTFYLLSDKNKLDDQIASFLGKKRGQDFARILNVLENKLGGWARAQGSLMIIVALANYAGLKLLGVPFALPLAILAGLLEIVPYIGPVIAAIPAVIIGFGTSVVLGIAVAALTFLIQQLENYLFVPKIMQKSTGVNPIVTLFCLAVGVRLGGVIGLLISIPVFITGRVLVAEYLLKK